MTTRHVLAVLVIELFLIASLSSVCICVDAFASTQKDTGEEGTVENMRFTRVRNRGLTLVELVNDLESNCAGAWLGPSYRLSNWSLRSSSLCLLIQVAPEAGCVVCVVLAKRSHPTRSDHARSRCVRFSFLLIRCWKKNSHFAKVQIICIV